MKIDKHNQAIPADVLAQVEQKIADIKNLLGPYMLALTAEERHALLKMGEKSLSFVQKAYEYAVKYPELCPPFLDISAFGIDYDDANGLTTLQSSIRQVDDLIADTIMQAGSEAMQAALLFYNSVKMAAAQDVAGAKAVYDELRKRFPSRKHRSAATDGE